MEFLKLYGEEDLHTLPSGVWGIREPDQFWKGHRRLNGMSLSVRDVEGMRLYLCTALDVECEGLDLILVPGERLPLCNELYTFILGESISQAWLSIDRYHGLATGRATTIDLSRRMHLSLQSVVSCDHR